MTTLNFSAQVRGWSEKARRNAGLVLRDAAQTVSDRMTERQPSIKETGSFEVGKVPVDTGELVQSQVTAINGSLQGSGDGAYVGTIAGLELGDTYFHGFQAEHAPYVENGTSKFPGRFFMREAVLPWQQIVDSSAQKFRDD